ncbi:TetR/AcrR family transcriptional regulator [Lacticaseibacillus paracasei]|uniref:TetR/AcrR family transcriptional regulator n=1 Tax=Lacticaseibacillus paracasei TaxID=1597 RepID=UPI0023597CB6|nr:TetR/AcrR family transcriptional regulator [Lacticaseibacillus paracasei]WCZ18150.1 TetR/AcrR family transcriptional regulator [Lacticaseibacillus paracasei]
MKQTSRDIQKQQTKQKIYQAAIKLIKRYGYAETSIRQITQEAHVSSGTFYVHYASKQDIIRENYYDELADYVKVHYSEYLKNHPKASIRDKIVYFSTLQLHLSAEQGWEFVTIVFTAFFEETLNPSNNLRDWEMLDTLRNLMIQANDANILINQDPQASFRQLYTSVRGMMATWAYSRGQFDIVQEGQAYLLNIINALISLR